MAQQEAQKQREISVYEDIKKYLGSKEVSNVIRSMIPKVVNGERLLNVTLTMIRANEKLMECSKSSLLAGIFTIAKLGLDPSVKQIHLIPFYNSQKKMMEATVIIDYRGYIAMGMRSGEVRDVSARPIYERDLFECEYGSNPFIKHTPAMKDRGQIVGFYSVVYFKDGRVSFEIMTVDDVEKRMATSKTSKPDKNGDATQGPWKEWYEDMGAKTVIRHHFKYLPVSVEELGLAGEVDDRGEVIDIGLLPAEAEKMLAGEGQAQGPGPVAMFDERAAKLIMPPDKPAWDTFLTETAKGNDVSVDELKVNFKDDVLAVAASFSKWMEKKKAQKETPGQGKLI